MRRAYYHPYSPHGSAVLTLKVQGLNTWLETELAKAYS